MIIRHLILLLFLLSSFQTINSFGQENTGKKAIMVIHGGAGTILRENMTEEKESEIRESMAKALQKGYKEIKKGRSSEEAVIAAIIHLEDDPNFNAGKGAVLNKEGYVEMDASIMKGSDLNAGAIAGVKNIKNPITAAREVMNNSQHVMLSGKGAEQFAEERSIETESPEYFIVEQRKKSWERAKVKSESSGSLFPLKENKFGTVGAVALDKEGNLCAATSTGGMQMKEYGRIGDSPIIGAGTYADNKTCGVSCTGHGEYFIRYNVAYDVSALMKYRGLSVNEAADEIIQNKLVEAGGSGGLIALDKDGNYSFSFNTPGMYRGVVFEDGTMLVEIFKD